MTLSVAPYWRQQSQRYRLEGVKCCGCGSVYFPKRVVCICCNSSEMKNINISTDGKIVSWTVIRAAPSGFESPYNVGIIELPQGIMVSGQIVGDAELIEIGKCVRGVFRKIRETDDDMIVYGLKFELVSDS